MTGDELLDTFDPAGRPLGPRARSVVHRDGLWHRVFHCLIVSGEGDAATVLLQQRHPAKAFGGRYDLSATGHLVAGEEPSAGVRELEEELGVDVSPDALVALGVRQLADDDGEGRNRELVHVFFVRDDRPLGDYRPDPREVLALATVSTAGLLALVTTATPSRARRRAAGTEEDTTITPDQLVPSVGSYWATLAIMADRFARAQLPLAI